MDILIKHSKELKEFCTVNRIQRLSVFGSYAKNTFKENSDLDILVEFEKGTKTGFLAVARIQRELSDLFGKKVDLHTPEELSKYFREDVVKEAVVQYAAK